MSRLNTVTRFTESTDYVPPYPKYEELYLCKSSENTWDLQVVSIYGRTPRNSIKIEGAWPNSLTRGTFLCLD